MKLIPLVIISILPVINILTLIALRKYYKYILTNFNQIKSETDIKKLKSILFLDKLIKNLVLTLNILSCILFLYFYYLKILKAIEFVFPAVLLIIFSILGLLMKKVAKKNMDFEISDDDLKIEVMKIMKNIFGKI